MPADLDRLLLADVFNDALTGWSTLRAEDGSTAADFAEQSGAQSINAMIQRKLVGQASGLEAQHFDFDPETGEWIDHEGDADAHSQYQTEMWLPISGKYEASAPLLVPAVPNNSTKLTPEEAISHEGIPQQTRIEAADSLLAMSSANSSWDGDGLRKSEDFAGLLHNGLHRRGSLEMLRNGVYGNAEQMLLEQKVHGSKAVPNVFDLRAALLSSAAVGVVGACALGHRFYLEYHAM